MDVAVAGIGLRQAAPTLLPGIYAPARIHRRTCCCAYKRPELKGIGEQRNQPRYRPHFASGLRLRARIRLCKYLVQRLLLKLGLVSLVQRRWKAILAGGAFGCTVALACVVSRLSAAVPAPALVPYSSLIEALEAQTVQRVLFEEGSPQIFFSLRENKLEQAESSGVGQELKPSWQYCARKIRHDETYLLSLLRAGKTVYMSAPRSVGATLGSVAVTVFTLWVPLAPLLWLMHRQLNGNSNFTKKRKKTVQLVRFGDVAGVDSAKAELLEIVSCLRGHSSYLTLGAKFPKGVLLIGPPGTGKTLLARALAGEAGVPFFATSASEFVEMFVGRGAARIRELFAAARKAAPSVIFIDELDAVGGQRGRGFTDERDQTLNQLLTEMDGFGAETGVLVLAATNRPEVLDPALCRPGRFSRKVYVREPDLEGRRQVLAVHTRNIRIGQDADNIQRTVAAMTPGFVGADLANVVNEAALLAARKGQTTVTLDNFKEAVHRAKYGVGQEPGLLSGLEKKVCSLLATVVPGAKEAGGGEASYQAVI